MKKLTLITILLFGVVMLAGCVVVKDNVQALQSPMAELNGDITTMYYDYGTAWGEKIFKYSNDEVECYIYKERHKISGAFGGMSCRWK